MGPCCNLDANVFDRNVDVLNMRLVWLCIYTILGHTLNVAFKIGYQLVFSIIERAWALESDRPGIGS